MTKDGEGRLDEDVPPPRAPAAPGRARPELLTLATRLTAFGAVALGGASVALTAADPGARWAAFIPAVLGVVLVVVAQRVLGLARVESRARWLHLAIPTAVALAFGGAALLAR